MRFQQNFAFEPELAKALNDFRISQEELYHYTKRSIAKQIQNDREIWLTRADSFLDDQEIIHGVSILKRIASNKLKGQDLSDFLSLVDQIDSRLYKCYIFSLSSDAHNNYLAQKYAHQETKVLFPPEFPMKLAHTSWHAKPNGNSGFSIHHAKDIYKMYEGFVEYEESSKKDIAITIADVFKKFTKQEPHVVDQFQFINLLTQFVIQAKKPTFYKEREYRISLVKIAEGDQPFEETRKNGGRDINYIRLKFPAEIKCYEIENT